MTAKHGQRGMTLIELLVTLAVALVIAATGTAVIPALLERSQAKEATMNLQRAVVAQTTYASTADGFATTLDALATLPVGRSLTFGVGSSEGRNDISVGLRDDGAIAMSVFVNEGSCLGVILENPYTSGVIRDVVAYEGTCAAASVPLQN
jgi:prepilin-type N-terminal cleavage/methylation domain-containing protein